MELETYEVSFCEKLEKHNIVLNENQLYQFRKYANLLIEWNSKMNLTAIDDIDGIYVKHFLDCILPSFSTTISGSLCDVGAGAGFPSIPLKIIYPALCVTIIEPLHKRCTFLDELIKHLGLNNVFIVNVRAEDYAKVARERFDVVSARAVANLTMLSELCIPLVKKNGIFLAMKGSNAIEELEEAKYAIKVLGCKCIYTDLYELEEAKRINFVFKKEEHTPKKYPRIFSKIKKEPLVRK